MQARLAWHIYFPDRSPPTQAPAQRCAGASWLMRTAPPHWERSWVSLDSFMYVFKQHYSFYLCSPLLGGFISRKTMLRFLIFYRYLNAPINYYNMCTYFNLVFARSSSLRLSTGKVPYVLFLIIVSFYAKLKPWMYYKQIKSLSHL